MSGGVSPETRSSQRLRSVAGYSIRPASAVERSLRHVVVFHNMGQERPQRGHGQDDGLVDWAAIRQGDDLPEHDVGIAHGRQVFAEDGAVGQLLERGPVRHASQTFPLIHTPFSSLQPNCSSVRRSRGL